MVRTLSLFCTIGFGQWADGTVPVCAARRPGAAYTIVDVWDHTLPDPNESAYS